MKTELNRTLLVAAVTVFVAGCVAWGFPRAVAAAAGAWVLPLLSIAALVLAVVLASEWPLLRALLLLLAIMLIVSWNRASMTSTSHFAGAALGSLLMVGIGRTVKTTHRLQLGLGAFLCVGLSMMLVGFAGASIRPGKLLDTAGTDTLPSIQLGLAGLDAEGLVNTNALAAVVLLVLPVGVAVLALGRRDEADARWVKAAAAVVTAVGTVILVLSHSRTAAIAIWLLAVGLLVRGMRPWAYRLVAGIIVVAPVALVTGRMPFLTQEIALRDANNGWVSARGRAQIIGQALDRLKESPWRGIGLNEFRHVYAPRPGDLPQAGDIAHVHNIALQTALDIGIIGSVAYWGVLAFLWVKASQAARGTTRVVRAVAVGSALSLVAVTLFGLTDAVTLGAKVGTLQWAAGGLILAAWHLRFQST